MLGWNTLYHLGMNIQYQVIHAQTLDSHTFKQSKLGLDYKGFCVVHALLDCQLHLLMCSLQLPNMDINIEFQEHVCLTTNILNLLMRG